MAINLDVQDLENFPGINKRITLDLDNVVLTDNYGDEKLLMTASTSAYSDNENRTSIPGLYVTEGKIGWNNSSPLVSVGGKYLLTALNNKLAVKIDATVSGTTGNGYYEIDLDYNANGTPKNGSDVAIDIQTKLRAIDCQGVDEGFKLAYKNAYAIYKDGSIKISSGSIANDYNGDNRSSVDVGTASSDDCSDLLGFSIGTSSSNFTTSSLESRVSDEYTTDSTPLKVGPNSGIMAGDALYITNKNGDEDYFTAIAVSGVDVQVAVLATNGYTGISHTYTVDDLSYVQVLKKGDPNQKVTSYFNNTDELLRYMTTSLITQIDFSS